MKKTIVSLRTALLLLALSCLSMTTTGQEMMMYDDPTEASVENLGMNLRNAPSRVILVSIGDVNLDGIVDIEDVTTLINGVLTGNPGINGDVNQDGMVDIEDVTMLINGVLTGSLRPALTETQALDALQQVYHSMRQFGWIPNSYSHQSFGISSYQLAAEVMGEDFIIGNRGFGWFWNDATYSQKSYFTNSTDRSCDLWYAHYSWISNANYLLQNCNSLTGTMGNYIKGQAYAIRAYSYFMLAQWFARTYKDHESDPCVPLFTGTVFNGSTGQPRATVAQVYAQIDADIEQAISLLNGTTQQETEHIGYAVALGLKARIALVKEDWATAYSSAVNAINASGKTIQNVSSFIGVNDATAGNVIWGAQIPEDEVTGNASFFSHMTTQGYGQRSPKLISNWLYQRISATDARLDWWRPNDTGVGPSNGYIQQKFAYSNPSKYLGDYIYMRVEEMYLTAAEAACRRGQTTTAKNYLTQLMAKRDPNYTCNKTGRALGSLTTDETGSLLEEILLQRRIELWGEDGRILTIRRLRQGFERQADWSWPTQLITNHSWNDPECYAWVMTIPLTEIMNNPNMTMNDQNPIGDYPEVKSTGPQNVSFVQALQEYQTSNFSYTVSVPVKRATTQGSYYAIVLIHVSDDMSLTNTNTFAIVHFNDGENQTTVNYTVSNLELNHDYYVDMTFSQDDLDNSSPALGTTITETRTVVHCVKGDPTGQRITFEAPEFEFETNYSSTSIHVRATRERTDNVYAASIVISDYDDNIELMDQRIIFNVGQDSYDVYLYVSGMVEGHSYSCVVSLSPEDAATAGGQYTSTHITVKRSEWNNIGTGTFASNFMTETFYPVIQRFGNTDRYRMLDLFNNGHDIEFTIEDNDVYIQPQLCDYLEINDFGDIYMTGFANEDDSGYAGTYDPNTKTASLQIKYYCNAGRWPTSTETLWMP